MSQVAEVKKMKIGSPLDRSTDHGPQNHKAHLDSLLSYVEKGVAEGATLVYGGKRLDREGKEGIGRENERTFEYISVRTAFSFFRKVQPRPRLGSTILLNIPFMLL